MRRILCSLIFLAVNTATGAPNSDCVAGNADSSCVGNVQRLTLAHPPSADVLYDGPIAAAPNFGAGYWGFDFLASDSGIPSPVPKDMFVNRSANAISLTFTFDVPPGNCSSGCRPGMEFKLGSKWNSFFPNIILAGNQAITSVQIAPGQAYGFVIALWQATNPHVRVNNLGASKLFLADVGLRSFSAADPVPGIYFQCQCGDGYLKQCYSGSHLANGYMGQWGNDNYASWDAVGCT